MTIDFILPSFEGGGAQRVVSVLSNQLVNKGLVVNIITFSGNDKYVLDDRVNRIRLHRRFLGKSVVLNGLVQLMLHYRKRNNRPNIMSVHNCYLVASCIPVSSLFKVKSVISEHLNHKSHNSRMLSIVRRYFYPKAEAVTVLTDYDMSFFKDLAKRVMVMPNPCPFPVVQGIPLKNSKRKSMLAVGDLDRYETKGFDSLIHVVEPLFTDYPDWKLIIAGEGMEGMRSLNRRIAACGLEANIELIGFQEDVQKLMGESDIFVLSSRFEGLPMSLIEAMSQGVACVAYDCKTGPSEIIEDEVTGLLVEDQNEQALTFALRRLMKDDGLRGDFARKAPKSMGEKYSTKVICQKWEYLFREVYLG